MECDYRLSQDAKIFQPREQVSIQRRNYRQVFDDAKAKGKAVEAPLKIVDLVSSKQGIVLVDEVGAELCILGVDGVVGMAPAKAQISDFLPVVMSKSGKTKRNCSNLLSSPRQVNFNVNSRRFLN
ncbi:hypothetical protein L9F63_015204 [Diploptera punctata]|uniref:Uncharacterized protein n=1 Tax=Diploptera punctata TaxID=6984 RepID=A0AAD8A8G9_DIPPU|nr:hypothetical protein L9F63_015204 [Diploptera punctata]